MLRDLPMVKKKKKKLASSKNRKKTLVSCSKHRRHFCYCRLLLLLLPSRFSRVRLCATPQMAAHRLRRPWDSPSKNAGVGCHCLLQCVKVKAWEIMLQSESPHRQCLRFRCTVAKQKVLVAQSCPTLCDLMDCSPPGSSVHGILQARTLEWVVIPFFR